MPIANGGATTSSVCSGRSGSSEPSPVLRAMGLPDRVAHGAIRFSLSRFTTEEEIGETLEALPPLIAHLRETLPT